MKKDGIKVKKIKLINKKIKADFKRIMEIVAKTSVMAAVGRWDNAAKEFASILGTVKIKKEPSDIAWNFILEALVNTAHRLIDENQWRLRRDLKDAEKLFDKKEYVEFLDGITSILKNTEIIIGPAFLKNPKSLEILNEFQEYFKEALLLFGIPNNEATQITNRLPSYFVFEVNDIWRRNVDHYSYLYNVLVTPFTESVDRELQWQAYVSFLNWQIDQPVFEESFSLRNIFVPLRAYFEKKSNDKGRFGHSEQKEKQVQKNVVWVEDQLNEWLQKKKTKDEIKMISGGPGAGKSSFAKMWAASLGENREWKVIFIPLHLFDIHGGIIDSVDKYLVNTPNIPFKHNPLESVGTSEKFLIIFDGLDELVMQGKSARDSATEFIDALEKICGRFNAGDTTILKILIAGRPISVQSADTKLRGSNKQVIHLLPYLVKEEAVKGYKDTNNLLPIDQRQIWWKKYHGYKGSVEKKMPKELQNDNLDKLTKDPLLNYLIALSWSFDPSKFGEKTNINEIYYTLIKGVFKRDYEEGRNLNIGNLKEDEFFQILEEIAVCAWHGGDVRVTSERKIEKHISDRGLKPLLEDYKKSVKGGVSRLLTAFYFRKYGRDENSEEKDETFEFTHKSFGEYLTARALVEMVRQINLECEEYNNNDDRRRPKGWTKQKALSEWYRVSSPTTFDNDLKKLVQNEIKLRSEQSKEGIIRAWQITLSEMISEVSDTGMPLKGERFEHKKERLLVQNAEIALLILLGSCAMVTKKISPIKWKTENSFWEWLHTMYSTKEQYFQARRSFSYFNSEWASLEFANMFHCDLQNANLQNTNLQHANLQIGILQNANLQHANLQHAYLQHAYLQNANLQNAYLQNANLQHANLHHANLQHANLQHANLQHAKLQHAYLDNANLQNANLQNANLYDANLQNANLQNAIGLTYKQLSLTYSLLGCKGIPKGIFDQLMEKKRHLI